MVVEEGKGVLFNGGRVLVLPDENVLKICCIQYNNVNVNQHKCPSTEEWIKKMWYIYTMEYCSAIKRLK